MRASNATQRSMTVDGQQYEVYCTQKIDSERFPETWPSAGWYWQKGVPSTTLMSKPMGPFTTLGQCVKAVRRDASKRGIVQAPSL